MSLAILGGTPRIAAGAHQTWPIVTEADEAALLQALYRKKWYSAHGEQAIGLAEDWQRYTGMPYVMAVDSCTSAIHLALLALGIGPGHRVLVTSYSYIGSVLPILYVGAEPAWCDITDDGTYTMDAQHAAARIRAGGIDAVIAVHVHGGPVDMDPIIVACAEKEIPIIEDACQSHGAT